MRFYNKALWQCLVLMVFFMPVSTHAELKLKLPRNTDGVEVLLGLGAGYDETAYLGEETLAEASLALAIMSDDFYLDFHEISYTFKVGDHSQFKVFGFQDGLPTEDDIPDKLNIKSGDSFDVGGAIEKELGLARIGALIAHEITGTHSGFLAEVSGGVDSITQNTRAGITVGLRYFDQKRSNYYFGVANDETNSDLTSYHLADTLTLFAEAIYLKKVTQNLAFVFDSSISSLAKSSRKSPRIKVDAHLAEVEVFIGLVFQFSALGGR